MANKFGVMAAPATGQIFVGRINHTEQIFLEKVDKTDEVLCAARDHLAALIPRGRTASVLVGEPAASLLS